LVWSNFEDWFHFILDVGKKKKQYAQITYLELTKFMYSWFDFKKNGNIPIVDNVREFLVWWRLRLGGSN
jgi:hypothetical protein